MRKLSKEHKAKIAAALRGKPKSAEQRAKQAATMTGSKLSDETKQKLSETHAGRPKSPAHREAISTALKAHFQANPKKRKESYFNAHAELGPASDHACISCGQTARDWAYQFTAREELIHEPQGWPYSLDPDDYAPMCRSCHKKFDYEQMAAWHAEDEYRADLSQ